MMESFFDILNSEIFYVFEKGFQYLKELKKEIVNYINYYNKRIKVKIKGLSLYLQ